VFIDPQPIRYYPHDDLLSTTLGYVGEITQAQLDDPRWKVTKWGVSWASRAGTPL